MIKYFVILTPIYLVPFQLIGQYSQDVLVTYDANEKTLIEVLYEIQKDNKVEFVFDPENLPQFEFYQKFEKEPLYKLIRTLLQGTNLMVVSINESTMAIVPRFQTKEFILNIEKKWKSGEFKYPFEPEIIEEKYAVGLRENSIQKQKINFVIQVSDGKNNEPLYGATVNNETMTVQESTDESGKVNLSLKPGDYKFYIKYLGYNDILLNLELFDDGEYSAKMQNQMNVLQEVRISAQRLQRDVVNKVVGIEQIDLKSLESQIQAMGEPDLLKSLERLPGITTTSEASAGFNVRGGTIDENLILYNDAVLINPTHLFGLMSAFNSDVLSSVKFSKGYMESQFGGWASSVLDIKSTYGNREKIHTKGALGISSAKIMAEGPLTKNLSFSLSGRKSYSDWMLRKISNTAIANSHASFFDVNGGLKFYLNEAHSLAFDFYQSSDNFDYNKKFGYNWGNKIFATAVTSIWNSKFNTKLSINQSTYTSLQNSVVEPKLYDYTSGTQISKIKLVANYNAADYLSFKGGSEINITEISPESIRVTSSSSSVQPDTIDRNDVLNLSYFLETNMEVSKKLTITGGLRYSVFSVFGDNYNYNYKDNFISLNNILNINKSTVGYKIGNYIEPRINISYKINDFIGLKSAYTFTAQPMHYLSNNNTTLPTDVWINSDININPKTVNQYTLAIAMQNFDKSITLNIEPFFKSIKNIILLKNFAELSLNDHIETEFVQGIGESKGTEFSLDVKRKRYNLNIGYTYSNSKVRSLDNRFFINGNKSFYSDNDIPHQINLEFVYKLTPFFTTVINYTYKSGRPLSVPENSIFVDGYIIPLFSNRNEYRIPNYSRLDIGFNADFKKLKSDGLRMSIAFGIYNLLGRANAQNVFFRQSEKKNIENYKLSIIGSAVPSLTLNFIY